MESRLIFKFYKMTSAYPSFQTLLPDELCDMIKAGPKNQYRDTLVIRYKFGPYTYSTEKPYIFTLA